MTHIRRRGTAVVETRQGILVVAGHKKVFMLPGGGAEKGETRTQASMRELKEETGLKSKYAKTIFQYLGKEHDGHKGTFQDNHTVCIVRAYGHPKPKNEIKHIAYYKPGTGIKLSSSTKEIIEMYYRWKEEIRDSGRNSSSQLHKRKYVLRNHVGKDANHRIGYLMP